MTTEADDYIAGIDPGNRPLFDRVHALIVAAHPDVDVRISYGIPTFVVGTQRLYVGAWKHGISLYGWGAESDGGFAERHPTLVSGKGTIRIRPSDAAEIPDADFQSLIAGALGP